MKATYLYLFRMHLIDKYKKIVMFLLMIIIMLALAVRFCNLNTLHCFLLDSIIYFFKIFSWEVSIIKVLIDCFL